MVSISRREAMKTALKAGAYAAPVILSATVPAAVSAQISGRPGLTGLFITNVAVPTSVPRGQGVNYNINVVNRGPTVATGVVVNTPLPPGQIFSGDGFVGGNFAYPVWTIGTLGVGASASLTIVAVVNATGTLTATLTATSPNPNPGTSVASATVTAT